MVELRKGGAGGRFAAVILAAGYSSRMKDFKPLLPVGGSTALEMLVGSVRAAGINDITVVTGYCRERLTPAICGLGVVEAYNGDYASGMFSSIKAGLRQAADSFSGAEGFLLMPVDCPLIDSATIAAVAEAAREGGENGRDFYVPVFEGKKGHPLFIPAAYVDEICSWSGRGGLKAVTDRHWERMKRIPVSDEGCLLDMDTPAGYREILEFLAAGRKRPSLESLAAGRRFFFVRHGQTRQHDEKMFIGQYDVPLSDEGREQIRRTAAQLALCRPETDVIYTSDLVRARESAEILNEAAFGGKARIAGCSGLREISLGEWDGRPVREIRETYPAEYERRGSDIFTFKTGNGAENFYDMQYRAVKELRRILQADRSRDIVIVTHSGVIRALENNLRGMRVDDGWQQIQKGDYRKVIAFAQPM